MIVLNLSCADQHRFEAWFRSNEDYHRQAEQGLLTCPLCGSSHITRLPSSPHIRRHGHAHGESQSHAPTPTHAEKQSSAASIADLPQMLMQKLAQLVQGAEDVGQRFPEEARKIHYNEVPPRSIRGVATLEESRELLEEGITVLPLPASETSH